nr:unnamed protein product [Callosobruchus chinensis]
MCPAFGKKCNKCGIDNHFAVACRVKNIRNVERDEATSEEEIFVGNVNNSNKKVCDKSIWEENLFIENRKVKVRLDTGADVNIIPLKIFKFINKQFKVRPVQYMLKAFEGSSAKPIGVTNLHCTYKNHEIYDDFVIVEGATQILLSGQACVNLSLIKRINNITVKGNISSERERFMEKNIEIFIGFGKFPGKHSITTKEKFETVCYPPTKIPIAIREEFKKELDRLVARNAIVKVEEISPQASINRIVAVEKASGKIRLCLDPSDINSQIVRKPKVGISIEEVCSNLAGKKIFSVFDLAEGYHHL